MAPCRVRCHRGRRNRLHEPQGNGTRLGGGLMAQRIERVGVLGAGLMGHGITQVAAQSGYEVVVREVDQAFDTALEFARSLGKLAIPTSDRAGFIVNRLLVPYMLDAIRAYEEGVGSATEIDEAMKAGAAHPMGPLTLADFVGLDTLGSICDVMFDEFRERRFARPPLLRKMLAAGWFGQKSGMGFYDYSGEAPVENAGI